MLQKNFWKNLYTNQRKEERERMRDKVSNIPLISLYNDFKSVWEIFQKTYMYICNWKLLNN